MAKIEPLVSKGWAEMLTKLRFYLPTTDQRIFRTVNIVPDWTKILKHGEIFVKIAVPNTAPLIFAYINYIFLIFKCFVVFLCNLCVLDSVFFFVS